MEAVDEAAVGEAELVLLLVDGVEVSEASGEDEESEVRADGSVLVRTGAPTMGVAGCVSCACCCVGVLLAGEGVGW